MLTGTGDVLEPEAGVAGIGSGGNYALAAARALVDGPLSAEEIVRRSLDIAADICVYTNRNVTIEAESQLSVMPRESGASSKRRNELLWIGRDGSPCE